MTSEELRELVKTGENGVVEFKCGRGGVPGERPNGWYNLRRR